MKAIVKAGKTIVELYEADKRALRKAESILRFIQRNSDNETTAQACGMAREGIADVLKENEEVDTPSEDVKPGTAAA